MTFVAKFDTNNSAFEDQRSGRTEIARLLREIAQHVEQGREIYTPQTVRDINGNDVGHFALKP